MQVGSNKWLGSNKDVNIYCSYPHFEYQMTSRYKGYTVAQALDKIKRTTKELINRRIYF